VQCRAAFPRREMIEHLLDEGRFEDVVGRTNSDAGLGESELHLPAVYRVENTRHVPLVDEPADGDRHRRRGHSEMLGEIREHRRRFGIEVIHDAYLARADERRGMRVANVPAMTGEVDPGVVAKNLGDVMTEAHDPEFEDNA